MTRTHIPRAPLLLGLSGLLPFIWGAATHLAPEIGAPIAALLGIGFSGQAILTAYGITILAFMSGTIWGFATRSPNPAAIWGFALSVLPALFGFFTFRAAPSLACLALAIGFAGLLTLDLRSQRLGEAPPWWLSLRFLLTSIVVLCLMVGALG
ncbi:MAG: DUF3429 domain-containing protein [Pseudomonadota bacterium]